MSKLTPFEAYYQVLVSAREEIRARHMEAAVDDALTHVIGQLTGRGAQPSADEPPKLSKAAAKIAKATEKQIAAIRDEQLARLGVTDDRPFANAEKWPEDSLRRTVESYRQMMFNSFSLRFDKVQTPRDLENGPVDFDDIDSSRGRLVAQLKEAAGPLLDNDWWISAHESLDGLSPLSALCDARTVEVIAAAYSDATAALAH